MNDTIMAEEMQSPKKVAFANRKYTNEDKRKMEEEELEQLMKEHLKSVTLICADTNKNKLKSLSLNWMQ